MAVRCVPKRTYHRQPRRCAGGGVGVEVAPGQGWPEVPIHSRVQPKGRHLRRASEGRECAPQCPCIADLTATVRAMAAGEVDNADEAGRSSRGQCQHGQSPDRLADGDDPRGVDFGQLDQHLLHSRVVIGRGFCGTDVGSARPEAARYSWLANHGSGGGAEAAARKHHRAIAASSEVAGDRQQPAQLDARCQRAFGRDAVGDQGQREGAVAGGRHRQRLQLMAGTIDHHGQLALAYHGMHCRRGCSFGPTCREARRVKSVFGKVDRRTGRTHAGAEEQAHRGEEQDDPLGLGDGVNQHAGWKH